ncbi:hypothetical protein [Natrialba asiatica]|uniref:Uncharacterized protein n=1 Tax=Natrialba asiatica (strain ATCC 700177 / DSM 12278 / JCM 9576 / FERM P-10747 / NBRC 102637 / 172P1) TaxID=29540 RepID=M0AH08_NATA1|nr:hypothetical protein [Natrialba asiatica]ELY97182.1 hypothetical protein C481_20716 [Natrialba asiatica DSM 12278]
MTDDPPRSADLPAGYDDLDPYADVDLETLPKWWRRNIELFREHGLRPYRPARLADGKPLPVVLNRLEDRYSVTITVRTVPSDGSETWSVWIDGDHVVDVRQNVLDALGQMGVAVDDFDVRVSISDLG